MFELILTNNGPVGRGTYLLYSANKEKDGNILFICISIKIYAEILEKNITANIL